MSSIDDQTDLLENQYKTPVNLNARANLHARFSTNRQGWLNWIFSHFDFPPDPSILEAGCGPGTLWLENLGRLSRSWKFTLTDFSSGMLEQARASLSEASSNFSFQVADIQDLPFHDHSFDAVIANHMLYHVPDLKKGLGEVSRVLNDSGWFYAATNGIAHMAELFELMSDFLGRRIHNSRDDFGFRLDNGGAILSEYFSEVEVLHFEDHLLVTEVAPLLDYYYSSGRLSEPIADRMEEFREFLEASLQKSGAIRIQKDAGTFIGKV